MAFGSLQRLSAKSGELELEGGGAGQVTTAFSYKPSVL